MNVAIILSDRFVCTVNKSKKSTGGREADKKNSKQKTFPVPIEQDSLTIKHV